MNLKENLYLRLQILEDNEVITADVTNYVKDVIEIVFAEKPDLSQDGAEMFFTHLAMASMRTINSIEENAMDEMVFEAVKQEPNYNKAMEIREKILSITNIEFSQTEKDFLLVHLCSILS